MSNHVRRWLRKKKRRGHSSNPPVLVFPILLLIVTLALFCLLIYGLSACHWRWDRLGI